MPSKAEVQQYATRLGEIPKFNLDTQDDVRAIGEEINERWGFDGMVLVLEYYRDNINRGNARTIEAMWSGIGRWRG